MFRALVVLLCALCCITAHAGYAQLAPPPGFSSVGGVSTMPVGAAANGARYAGGHVLANASLNVGARSVVVPVAFRVAANAAVFTVTRLNPWISGGMLAVSAIGLVVDWFNRDPSREQPLQVVDGRIVVPGQSNGSIAQYVNAQGQTMTENCPSSYSGGVLWTLYSPGGCGGGGNDYFWRKCLAPGHPDVFDAELRCVKGGTTPGQASSPSSPATAADVAPLGNVPVNPALLPELGLPIPIDPVPVINPSSAPTGDVLIGPDGNPAPDLQPSTLRVPNGSPEPIPDTSPQQYQQPWLDIVPSPTPSSPWQVDIRPVTTVTNSPVTPTDPVTNPQTPSTPAQPDLCEKNPGILACQPEGSFSDSALPAIPVLYERKYPDGMVGIWQQKKQALSDAPLAQLASQIMPQSVGDGGCPQWQLPLNVGIFDFGVRDFSIPCEYWGYIRILMIVSSLFLARALIFGG